MLLESEEATRALGRSLAAALRIGDVVALSGGLGAGKTMLARGILTGLGHEGEVASPTFPIVIAYELAVPVRHVDLYRIEDDSELAELGLEEARGEAALVVEWPERLEARFLADALALRLDAVGEDARALTALVPPAWAGRWPPR